MFVHADAKNIMTVKFTTEKTIDGNLGVEITGSNPEPYDADFFMLKNVVCKTQDTCYFSQCITSSVDSGSTIEVPGPSSSAFTYRLTFTLHNPVCLEAFTFDSTIFDDGLDLITMGPQTVIGNKVHYDITIGQIEDYSRQVSHENYKIDLSVKHTARDRQIISSTKKVKFTNKCQSTKILSEPVVIKHELYPADHSSFVLDVALERQIQDSVSLDDTGDGFTLCRATRSYQITSSRPAQLTKQHVDSNGKLRVEIDPSAVNSAATQILKITVKVAIIIDSLEFSSREVPIDLVIQDCSKAQSSCYDSLSLTTNTE